MGFRGKGFINKDERQIGIEEKGRGVGGELRCAVPLSSLNEDVKNDKEALAKAVQSGQVLIPDDVSVVEAYHVGQAYYRTLGEYYNTAYPIDWKSRLSRNRGAVGCCSRAYAHVQILQCSVEDYIESQFWAFDRFFKRAPQWKDIAAPAALKRFQTWIRLVQKGEVLGKTVNISVVSVYAERGSTSDVVLQYEERVLRSMVQQWGSEERVWELFGDLGDQEIFSDSFKRTRDVWKTMYGART